jgi:hypothetical protein
MSPFEEKGLFKNFPEELGWWDRYPDPLPSTNPETNPEGYDYSLNITAANYVAQQSALYLQLPLLVDFENTFTPYGHLGWYASGGVKLGYAVIGSSEANIQSVSATPNYFAENGEVPAPPFLGFGVTENLKGVNANLDLGFHGLVYLEAGFKQQLTDQYSLYAGFFGEYCFYSATGTSASNMLEHEILPERYEQTWQQVLPADASAYQYRYKPSANVEGRGVESSYLLSFGITVRISFAFSTKTQRRNDQLFNIRYFQF